MARKTVLVSDLSGESIPDGKGATIRVTYRDARRGSFEADVTDSEAEAFVRTGLARWLAGDASQRRRKRTTCRMLAHPCCLQVTARSRV